MTRPILALLNSSSSWWDDGAASGSSCSFFSTSGLSLTSVVISGTSWPSLWVLSRLLALLQGFVPADGELRCCYCSLQSTASLMVNLQVIVAGKRAQYRNKATYFIHN